MENVTEIAAAASAVAAAIAAIASWSQTINVSNANRVNLFLHFSSIYADPSMREAIAKLSEFWRLSNLEGTTPLNKYIELERIDSQSAKEIRGYNRIVATYFIDCVKLYESKIISRRFLFQLVNRPGINIFYEVSTPINVYKNGGEELKKC